ncbi:hypothetical protein [uncultured Paludibaculum sp.]|uniref:hypothetical protein n=1 Tax=uncultured Paludibaculum sp. TaxID=1765020 RepID=UPI002AABC812|nr:hypothetical protein [uncultured Paludibaculum sp.]
MIQKQMTTESLGEIYTVALLLAGSRRRAEAAMTESLRLLEGSRIECDTLEERLFRSVVKAAISGPQHSEDEPGLPDEMRKVLLLPSKLRHSFVLRYLRGLRPETCAWHLSMCPEQVDEYAVSAARALAAGTVREKAA